MTTLFNAKLKTRKRRKFPIVKAIIFLLLIIPGLFIYGFGVALAENIKADQTIEDFKSRANGVYTEVSINYNGTSQTRRYYEVSRETSYEQADTRSVFYDDSHMYLGQKGDIFVAQASPFPNIPVFHQFMSFYFGGHASINNGQNRFIEATGFPGDGETVLDIILQPGNVPNDHGTKVNLTGSNYWLNPKFRLESDPDYPYYGSYYRPDFVGLRVKNITSEQIDGAVEFANDQVDWALYNFTFFLDMKYKFYCTDLVSRAYQSVMVPVEEQRNYSRALNDDRFITSVNDLILSDETYISFYVEIENNIVNIYYLADL